MSEIASPPRADSPLWISIPPEITQHIFSYLDDHDLVKVAAVCRHFYDVAYQLSSVMQDYLHWSASIPKKQHEQVESHLESDQPLRWKKLSSPSHKKISLKSAPIWVSSLGQQLLVAYTKQNTILVWEPPKTSAIYTRTYQNTIDRILPLQQADGSVLLAVLQRRWRSAIQLLKLPSLKLQRELSYPDLSFSTAYVGTLGSIWAKSYENDGGAEERLILFHPAMERPLFNLRLPRSLLYLQEFSNERLHYLSGVNSDGTRYIWDLNDSAQDLQCIVLQSESREPNGFVFSAFLDEGYLVTRPPSETIELQVMPLHELGHTRLFELPPQSGEPMGIRIDGDHVIVLSAKQITVLHYESGEVVKERHNPRVVMQMQCNTSDPILIREPCTSPFTRICHLHSFTKACTFHSQTITSIVPWKWRGIDVQGAFSLTTPQGCFLIRDSEIVDLSSSPKTRTNWGSCFKKIVPSFLKPKS